MICYRDMTFCSASDRCGTPNCGRRFTDEEHQRARLWWGSSQDREDPPVAFADYSRRLCFTPAEIMPSSRRFEEACAGNLSTDEKQNPPADGESETPAPAAPEEKP